MKRLIQFVAFVSLFCKYIYLKMFGRKLVPGEAVKPREKFKFNPFLKYPRNETCYCGSGKKYKKCCMANEPAAIPEDVVPRATKLIKKIRAKKKNG